MLIRNFIINVSRISIQGTSRLPAIPLRPTAAFSSHLSTRPSTCCRRFKTNTLLWLNLKYSALRGEGPRKISSIQYFRKMSSDDAYSSFLDQANQDASVSKTATSTETVSTKAVDTEIPVGLQNFDQYYTSESDEPFEPVSLLWNGKNMPSESISGLLCC